MIYDKKIDDKKVELYDKYCELLRGLSASNPRQKKLNYINNCIRGDKYFDADKFIPLREEIKQQERENKLNRILK